MRGAPAIGVAAAYGMVLGMRGYAGDDFEGELLVIPNVPAYACDVCRQTWYDPGFLLNVENLLNKSETPKRAKKWQSGANARVSRAS